MGHAPTVRSTTPRPLGYVRAPEYYSIHRGSDAPVLRHHAPRAVDLVLRRQYRDATCWRHNGNSINLYKQFLLVKRLNVQRSRVFYHIYTIAFRRPIFAQIQYIITITATFYWGQLFTGCPLGPQLVTAQWLANSFSLQYSQNFLKFINFIKLYNRVSEISHYVFITELQCLKI